MNAKLPFLLFAFVFIFNLKAFNQNAQIIDSQRFIETVGIGQVEFVPNNITYKISISTDDIPMDDASGLDNTEARLLIYKEKVKSAYQERYAKVWEVLKSEKIKEKALIENINFDFTAEYLSNMNTKDFNIEIDDIEKLKNIAVKLRGLPYCSGSIVEMSSARRGELEMQAKLLAIKDAQSKAEKLASAFNARLGKALQIIDNQPIASQNNTISGFASYPTTNNDGQESYLIKSNIEKSVNGKLFIKQSMSVRFNLE